LFSAFWAFPTGVVGAGEAVVCTAFWAGVAYAINRFGTFTGTRLTNSKHTHTTRLEQKNALRARVGFRKKKGKQGEHGETEWFAHDGMSNTHM